MKVFSFLILTPLLLYACAGSPLSVAVPYIVDPQETVPPTQSESELRYAIAKVRLKHNDVQGAVHSLVAAEARLQAPPSQLGSQIVQLLAKIETGLTIKKADGWIERSPGTFFPENPDNGELPLPAFSLVYENNGVAIPAEGIPYVFEFVAGGGLLTHGDETGVDGSGACSTLEQEDPLGAAGVRLRFRFQNGDFTHNFNIPVAHFLLPAPRLFINIGIGETVKDVLDELEKRRLTTQTAFLELATEEMYPEMPFVPVPVARINRYEGLFKPGSFPFFKKDIKKIEPGLDAGAARGLALSNIRTIVATLLQENQARFAEVPDVRGLGPYQQLILASIVEKEAAANHDYDKISSVFYNRMEGGSRLGSCPTVEYALGYHRPFLLRKDIGIDSPYNVYRKKGLPPTPICFFSDQALDAVRNPPENDLYYFVYDWTMEKLSFARSYDDHLRNAEIARANYVEKYGKDALFEIHYDKFYED